MQVDSVFEAGAKIGHNVLVFDFFGDWPGMEAAIHLSDRGHHVTLNLFNHEVQTLEEWNTVVLSLGRIPSVELFESLRNKVPKSYQIGDCLAPRTIEEAT